MIQLQAHVLGHWGTVYEGMAYHTYGTSVHFHEDT